MNKIRVTKEFTFEMAHALSDYDGPCRNIHGHSYKLLVTLVGEVIHDKNHSNDGMVIDFSHLKKIVRKNVIEPFDHALMLNKKTPQGEFFASQQLFEHVLLVDFQPTSENILLEIVRRIQPELPDGVLLHNLHLWETATSSASWYAEDNGVRA